MLKRLLLVVFTPLLLIPLAIDLVAGDIITGVKVSLTQKLKDHKAAWLEVWDKT